VATAPGALALKLAPVPRILPDEVLIRVAAVALNPSDHKLLDQSTTVGAISGADFAGTVVRVGSDAQSLWKVGDRVMSITFGANPGNPGNGAFSEYVAALAVLCVRLPDDYDFAAAASLPMGVYTTGLVFRALGLSLDEHSSLSRSSATEGSSDADDKPPLPPFVLVHGGGTATGTIALQMLRIAGYRPIATCSPSSFKLAMSRGAIVCFDYNSPTVRDEIRSYTHDSLCYAIDCIGSTETMTQCYGVIGEQGGKYASLEQYPRRLTIRRRDVAHSWILGWTILGREVKLGGAYYRPETPEDRDFGEAWAKKIELFLKDGQLQTHPLEISKGGLPAVVPQLNYMRKFQAKGRKYVFLV
jgi:aspyridone synthetase trans-acting enoyl reductase